ncbi:MAG: hypothetical protein JNK66_00125 [Chitinophagales bacterium]|nr:hypothetical protein [Chitinophagales bacterium]
MKLSLLVTATAMVCVISCKKPCANCESQPVWNDSTVYSKNTVVFYGNECYTALKDSATAIPGEWGKLGNYDWVSCNTF